MTATLVSLEQRTNADALQLVEGLLERLKAGEVADVAIVEVSTDRVVGIAWTGAKSSSYHLLNSGAARLASRLAQEE